MRGQHAVGAAEDRVLFVQQGGTALADRRQQGRGRGVAAEADGHGDVEPAEGRTRLQHPAADGQSGLRQTDRTRAGGGVQRQSLLSGKGGGVLFAAPVSGQDDVPAATGQFAGQGLGGEHMTAGASGGDDTDSGGHGHSGIAPPPYVTRAVVPRAVAQNQGSRRRRWGRLAPGS